MKTAVALAVLALAPAALADILVYKFSGIITEVEGPAPAPVGTAYTFEYRFDSNTPDTDPFPNFGAYTGAIQDALVDLDGFFQFGAAPGDISILNNGFAGDTYSARVENATTFVQVNLGDLQGSVFGDDHLPAVISLQPFELRQVIVHGEIGPVFWEVTGNVKTLEVAFIDCYPDCNGDGALNLSDFGCFTTKFALGDPYADCNGDATLNLADFGCFTTKFALGCP